MIKLAKIVRHIITESSTTLNIDQQFADIAKADADFKKFIIENLINSNTTIKTNWISDLRVYTYEQPNIDVVVKKKYPDLIFALTALNAHITQVSEFTKWEMLDTFLNFKGKHSNIEVFRFMRMKSTLFNSIVNDNEKIPFPEKDNYTSFSLNPDIANSIIFNDYSDSKIHPVTLRYNLPIIFDVYNFTLQIVNALKKYFPKSRRIDTFEKFIDEKEVICKPPKFISKDNILGLSVNNKTYKLDEYPVIRYLPWTDGSGWKDYGLTDFPKEDLIKMKDGYTGGYYEYMFHYKTKSEYSYTFELYCVTNDPNKFFKKYEHDFKIIQKAYRSYYDYINGPTKEIPFYLYIEKFSKKSMIKNEDLSKLLGIANLYTFFLHTLDRSFVGLYGPDQTYIEPARKIIESFFDKPILG